MIAQRRLFITSAWVALSGGLLVICACSDSVMDPGVTRSGEYRPDAWMGHYANAPDTLAIHETPTAVQAQLDLYASPACHLYATFTTEDPDDWTFFQSDNCLYRLVQGAVILTLKLRVHYPGGNELIEGIARFEAVDESWTAVVWKSLGIRLDKEPHSAGRVGAGLPGSHP
jgi:hypothetical protein